MQRVAWDQADHHTTALEDFVRPEPLAWAISLVARGHGLAAFGQGARLA
jgi:hypothetical protein